MRKLFNVKHRFLKVLYILLPSSWGVYPFSALTEIFSAQRVFCHITIVEVFVFVVYIDKSEYSARRIIHAERSSHRMSFERRISDKQFN